MPIELSDISASVVDYLNNHVTVEVSDVSSGGTIEKDDDGTFSVTVTNAAAPDGVRLVNVRYHLFFDTPGVAKFVADGSALAPNRETINPNDPILGSGDEVDVLFVFPAAGFLSQAELDIGEVTVLEGRKVRGKRVGDATIKCHIHADVDEAHLFPQSENSPNGNKQFSVT